VLSNRATAADGLLPSIYMTILSIMSYDDEVEAMDTWTVAQAKAKFSELINLAHSRGPQMVTRNGRRAAVIVAPEEWERKTRRSGSLAEFFANSPLRGSGLEVKRLRGEFRKVDL
jgi:prevent-host-death family protein